jgi:hypothetical protein
LYTAISLEFAVASLAAHPGSMYTIQGEEALKGNAEEMDLNSMRHLIR